MVILIDCLAVGRLGKRKATIDVVGVGPRVIAGILESFNYDYEIYKCSAILENPEILKKHDVILVSAMSSDKFAVLKVVKIYKRIKPSGLAIVGGPIFVEDQELLSGGFDIAVRNEGEITLSELIRNGVFEGSKDVLNTISGISYKVGNKIVRNKQRAFLTRAELNKFKHSVEAVKFYENYWGLRVYVEVVRGCSNFHRPKFDSLCLKCDICRKGPLSARIYCPANIPPGCGYCSVPSLFGPARSRDPYLIYSEVSSLIKLGVKRITLSAPDFLDYGRDLLVEPNPLTDPRNPPPNLEYIDKLLKLLTSINEVKEGEVVILIENIKPNLVSEEVAELLGKYLQDTTIHIGLETGDEEHHQLIGRPSTVNEVLKAVKLLRSYGLRPYIYLIHGLPGQSEKTIRATLEIIDKLKELGVEKITLYRFSPLKGSAFEKAPKPPPAVKDEISKKLYEKVKEFNYLAKKELVGKVIEAISVGRKGRYVIAYPLKHGPVILTEGSEKIIKKILKVKITDVVSDRLVKGKVISFRKL